MSRLRLLAGVAAAALLGLGIFLTMSGRAEVGTVPPSASAGTGSADPAGPTPIPDAPQAEPRNKEQKRFARADRDEDGRISLAELVEPRRKSFAKLDVNADGNLSFEEWAKKSIDKFAGADADHDKWLSRAEYATTAPKPRPKKPGCACA